MSDQTKVDAQTLERIKKLSGDELMEMGKDAKVPHAIRTEAILELMNRALSGKKV